MTVPVTFSIDFPDHDKVAPLTDAAFRLHVRAIFYCARELTDGHLTQDEVCLLATPHDADQRLFVPADHARTLARELVSRRLWRDADGGYEIHDFADYQVTRDELLGAYRRDQERRQGAAERQRRSRSKRAGPSRDTRRVTPLEPPAVDLSPTATATGRGGAADLQDADYGELETFRRLAGKIRDADERTPIVLASVCRGLPEAVVAAAFEQLERRRGDLSRGALLSEARYVVATLKRIREGRAA